MAFTYPGDLNWEQYNALVDYVRTATDAGHVPDDECEVCIAAKSDILRKFERSRE